MVFCFFLDCKITRSSNDMLNSSVFKKPTHSDRYLDFHSAHPLYVKSKVIEKFIFKNSKNRYEWRDGMKERSVVLDILRKTTTLLVLYTGLKIDQWEMIFKGHKKQEWPSRNYLRQLRSQKNYEEFWTHLTFEYFSKLEILWVLN